MTCVGSYALSYLILINFNLCWSIFNRIRPHQNSGSDQIGCYPLLLISFDASNRWSWPSKSVDITLNPRSLMQPFTFKYCLLKLALKLEYLYLLMMHESNTCNFPSTFMSLIKSPKIHCHLGMVLS